MKAPKITCNVVAARLILLAEYPSHADRLSYDVPNLSPTFQQKEDGQVVCDAVQKAIPPFNEFSPPPLSNPVGINVVDDLPQELVGLYLRGEDLIEALSAPRMQERQGAYGTFMT